MKAADQHVHHTCVFTIRFPWVSQVGASALNKPSNCDWQLLTKSFSSLFTQLLYSALAKTNKKFSMKVLIHLGDILTSSHGIWTFFSRFQKFYVQTINEVLQQIFKQNNNNNIVLTR